MILTTEKINPVISSSVASANGKNVYKGKFRRPLTKSLSMWTSLFPNGLNACTIDAERQGWNAPRFGVGMFHVRAMMLGDQLFLIKDNMKHGLENNTLEEDGDLERLVLELSVKYDITPDKKIAKSQWNWSGMSSFIKNSENYLPLMDEVLQSDVSSFIKDERYEKREKPDFKCKKLCMQFDYSPELLTSRDCPEGIRQTYSKNRVTKSVIGVTSYVLKQYFSYLRIERDVFMHEEISKGVERGDTYLFNGGIISPKEAFDMLNAEYGLTNGLRSLTSRV